MKLIKEAFDNGVSMDELTIEYMIVSLLEKKGIRDLVKEIKHNNYGKYRMTYFQEPKFLALNMKVINDDIYNQYIKFMRMSDNPDYAHYYNYNLLIHVLHGLDHIRQYQIANERNDSLGMIASEGVELTGRVINNLSFSEKYLYKYNKEKVLTEKNAQVMGLINTLELNKELKVLAEEDIITINYRLAKVLLYNYSKSKSASERYYSIRGKRNEFKQIPFTEEYDNITKLSWGMPISRDLYNYVDSLKQEPFDVKEKILKY